MTFLKIYSIFVQVTTRAHDCFILSRENNCAFKILQFKSDFFYKSMRTLFSFKKIRRFVLTDKFVLCVIVDWELL